MKKIVGNARINVARTLCFFYHVFEGLCNTKLLFFTPISKMRCKILFKTLDVVKTLGFSSVHISKLIPTYISFNIQYISVGAIEFLKSEVYNVTVSWLESTFIIQASNSGFHLNVIHIICASIIWSDGSNINYREIITMQMHVTCTQNNYE